MKYLRPIFESVDYSIPFKDIKWDKINCKFLIDDLVDMLEMHDIFVKKLSHNKSLSHTSEPADLVDFPTEIHFRGEIRDLTYNSSETNTGKKIFLIHHIKLEIILTENRIFSGVTSEELQELIQKLTKTSTIFDKCMKRLEMMSNSTILYIYRLFIISDGDATRTQPYLGVEIQVREKEPISNLDEYFWSEVKEITSRNVENGLNKLINHYRDIWGKEVEDKLDINYDQLKDLNDEYVDVGYFNDDEIIHVARISKKDGGLRTNLREIQLTAKL